MYEEEVKKEPEGDNTPAWMLTFADLVSLLICFFVLLYSMKTVDESIWKQISGSFAGALNYSQKFKEVNPNSQSGVQAEKILSSDSMEYIDSILTAKLAKEGLLSFVKISMSGVDNSLHIDMPASNIFVGDTTQLTEKGEKVLTFISESILYIDEDVEIASYTKYNDDGTAMQDSMLRSLAVRDFIVKKGYSKYIKIVGYGSQEYEFLQPITNSPELEEKSVKLEFIIRSVM